MAPTVCVGEIGDRRRPFCLEDHLQRALRISQNDGVRCAHPKRITHKVVRLNRTNNKVCKVMGLVVDQGVREEESPGLPPRTNSPTETRETSQHAIRKKEGLIDITLRTMALLRRNQELQKRLTALQIETRAFVKSVLSEQENRQQEIDK